MVEITTNTFAVLEVLALLEESTEGQSTQQMPKLMIAPKISCL